VKSHRYAEGKKSSDEDKR
jgi:hypothetical protein